MTTLSTGSTLEGHEVNAVVATTTGTTGRVACRVNVAGVVQGVGFRPFVWRLAHRHHLAGAVRNCGGSVEIDLEGAPDDIERFCGALEAEAPPRAVIDEVHRTRRPTSDLSAFTIDLSESEAGDPALIPPDVATCPACLDELLDPANRRHGYAFVNCVDCGPRYTVIEDLPYDRERTSMRRFPLCADCAHEYRDPMDRRFHAEPVACPACGPQLELRDAAGRPVEGEPVGGAAQRLLGGEIVALKALGGYHLVCDATNELSIALLRRRKVRPDKPFAVMVRDVDVASQIVHLDAAETELLTSWRAPIVLARDRGRLAYGVAPGHRRRGVMLPATPLHHLLMRAVDRPLVMTSGNRSDEPICTGNDEAQDRLAGIADAFLVHDRKIVARYDDSLTAVRRGVPAVLRRARGFAPEPVGLLSDGPPVLACGAHLQVSFCVAAGSRAFMSPHIGDLDNDMAIASFREALERCRRLFGIDPVAIAHDRHPDFLTTRLAESMGAETIPVQHHHAHIAAVMAEHRLSGRVIGVALDGFGLGDDDTAWGGEFLIADAMAASRAGHLRPVAQPGGDAAVREPARMAVAHAAAAGCLADARPLLDHCLDGEAIDRVTTQVQAGVAAGSTTSAGRLFDAVAVLLGLVETPTYEGHAAVLLEQAADPEVAGDYPFDLAEREGRLMIDTRPLVEAVVAARCTDRPVAEIAGRFHRSLARAVSAVCEGLRIRSGLGRVCLGGGVFANDLLLDLTVDLLTHHGFDVYWPRSVPPGDGGLALGQALVARARLVHADRR